MNAVFCLDCDRRLNINSKYDVGDAIKCPNCDSEFEIVSLQPPAIEWLYDSYDDYDDEDENEDDDDDEEEEEEEQEEVLTRRAAVHDRWRPNERRLIFSTDGDE